MLTMIATNDFAIIKSPYFVALDAIHKINQTNLYRISWSIIVGLLFALLEKKFLTVSHHRTVLLLLLLLVFEFNSHPSPPSIS